MAMHAGQGTLGLEILQGVEALDAIVRRATEKDVDRRYQSWSEFSHDLALAYRNLGALLATETALGDTGKFEALRAMRFFHRFAGDERHYLTLHVGRGYDKACWGLDDKKWWW